MNIMPTTTVSAANTGPGSRCNAAEPPPSQPTTWPRDAVDRFILAKLERRRAETGGRRRRVTLIRRVTFDLTGLPPTTEEIDAFVADESPDAYERVVDRLLASPAFGERWGRHWLDVARYGESTGSSRNIPLSARLAVSRLRHRLVQRRQTVRPVYPRTDRRRSAARRIASSSGASNSSPPAFWRWA